MASGFTLQLGMLRANVDVFDLKVHQAISLAVDYHATKGEAEMKVRAPWTDQTGAARSGLHSSTSHGIGRWEMTFAHSVSYGIWLETRNSFHGRYAIIVKTTTAAGEDLMRTLDGLFRKI